MKKMNWAEIASKNLPTLARARTHSLPQSIPVSQLANQLFVADIVVKKHTDPFKVLETARKELKEDCQQASEKAWLALDVQVKELANQGKVSIESHDLKNFFINFVSIQLDLEDEIYQKYVMAQDLHNNFYRCHLEVKQIILGMNSVEELINILKKFRMTEEQRNSFIKYCSAKKYECTKDAYGVYKFYIPEKFSNGKYAK